MAVNAPMQGTAADMIKLAMGRADALIEERGWRGKVELVLQVHDELVYEVDEALVTDASVAIGEAMSGVLTPESLRECGVSSVNQAMVAKMGVPVTVEAAAGKNWAEMSPVKVTSNN